MFQLTIFFYCDTYIIHISSDHGKVRLADAIVGRSNKESGEIVCLDVSGVQQFFNQYCM